MMISLYTCGQCFHKIEVQNKKLHDLRCGQKAPQSKAPQPFAVEPCEAKEMSDFFNPVQAEHLLNQQKSFQDLSRVNFSQQKWLIPGYEGYQPSQNPQPLNDNQAPVINLYPDLNQPLLIPENSNQQQRISTQQNYTPVIEESKDSYGGKFWFHGDSKQKFQQYPIGKKIKNQQWDTHLDGNLFCSNAVSVSNDRFSKVTEYRCLGHDPQHEIEQLKPQEPNQCAIEKNFINEDLKTMKCKKCAEELIEQFKHEHYCRPVEKVKENQQLKCNQCGLICKGYQEFADHLDAHLFEQEGPQQQQRNSSLQLNRNISDPNDVWVLPQENVQPMRIQQTLRAGSQQRQFNVAKPQLGVCPGFHPLKQFNRPFQRQRDQNGQLRVCDHCRKNINAINGDIYFACNMGCSYDICKVCHSLNYASQPQPIVPRAPNFIHRPHPRPPIQSHRPAANNPRIHNSDAIQFDGDRIPQNLLDQLGEMHLKDSEKPVKKNILSQLPTHKFTSAPDKKDDRNDDKRKCTICFEDYVKGEDLLTLPCFHSYHNKCIETWFLKQDFCPICRTKI